MASPQKLYSSLASDPKSASLQKHLSKWSQMQIESLSSAVLDAQNQDVVGFKF